MALLFDCCEERGERVEFVVVGNPVSGGGVRRLFPDCLCEIVRARMRSVLLKYSNKLPKGSYYPSTLKKLQSNIGVRLKKTLLNRLSNIAIRSKGAIALVRHQDTLKRF